MVRSHNADNKSFQNITDMHMVQRKGGFTFTFTLNVTFP